MFFNANRAATLPVGMIFTHPRNTPSSKTNSRIIRSVDTTELRITHNPHNTRPSISTREVVTKPTAWTYRMIDTVATSRSCCGGAK